MRNPLVSIVILNYNRLQELREGIRRINDIPYKNLEIIIVDNGSSDGSVEYINTLDDQKYDKRLLSSNTGTAYGRTQGQKAATGEFVIHLDDDAFLRPSVIKRTLEVFDTNPNLGIIGYGLVNPNTAEFSESDYWADSPSEFKPNAYHDSYHFPVSPSGAAFRRSVLEEVGYFDLNWDWTTRTEDNELTLKIIAHGYNTVIIDDLIVYHQAVPSHRQPEILTINGIHGIIWIILKFFPSRVMVPKLIRFLYLAIYFTIVNRKLTYLKAIFRSLKRAHRMLNNKKRLSYEIAAKIDLREIWFFSMSDTVVWGGE
jgi:GT2 family glycosyltransferase